MPDEVGQTLPLVGVGAEVAPSTRLGERVLIDERLVVEVERRRNSIRATTIISVRTDTQVDGRTTNAKHGLEPRALSLNRKMRGTAHMFVPRVVIWSQKPLTCHSIPWKRPRPKTEEHVLVANSQMHTRIEDPLVHVVTVWPTKRSINILTQIFMSGTVESVGHVLKIGVAGHTRQLKPMTKKADDENGLLDAAMLHVARGVVALERVGALRPNVAIIVRPVRVQDVKGPRVPVGLTYVECPTELPDERGAERLDKQNMDGEEQEGNPWKLDGRLDCTQARPPLNLEKVRPEEHAKHSNRNTALVRLLSKLGPADMARSPSEVPQSLPALIRRRRP